MRKRNRQIIFRLTEREYQHLKRQIDLTGLSMSACFRTLIAGQQLSPRPPEELRDLIRELNSIGININQMARIANSRGYVSQEDFEALRSMLSNIWRKVKGL